MYAKKVAVNQQIFLELNYYKVTTSSNIYVPLNSSIPPSPKTNTEEHTRNCTNKMEKGKNNHHIFFGSTSVSSAVLSVWRELCPGREHRIQSTHQLRTSAQWQDLLEFPYNPIEHYLHATAGDCSTSEREPYQKTSKIQKQMARTVRQRRKHTFIFFLLCLTSSCAHFIKVTPKAGRPKEIDHSSAQHRDSHFQWHYNRARLGDHITGRKCHSIVDQARPH